MAIVGTAEITIVADDSTFASSLEAGTAPGFAAFDEQAKAAGAEAGASLGEGVKAGTAVGDESLATTSTAVKKVGSDAESSGGSIKKALSGLGVPESLLGGWGVAGVAIAGTAAAAISLGSTMQSTTTHIATASDTSVASAQKITTAFLGTAGTTEFSGNEIASAFAGVAGQLKSTEGHALDTAQAMTVMGAAQDLAAAKGISLNSATSALVSTMQAFQVPVKGAADVSNILFNASNALGTSVDNVGGSLDKVKAKLGDVAPPIGQLSGLLVDMTNHGETGRAAMTALNTTFTTFLAPAAAVAKAQADLNTATKNLPPSLDALSKQYATGNMTATQVTAATKGLTTSQLAAFDAFKKASDGVTTANQGVAAMGINATTTSGKLAPMGDIIGQLQDKIKGMNNAQATAELSSLGFKNASAKLVETIQAGPSAYDKATASVTKMNSAHEAAEKQDATLKGQLDTLKSAVEDYLTQIGTKLVPVLTELAKIVLGTLVPAIKILFDVFGTIVSVVEKVASFLGKNKEVLIGLAAAIGAVLIPVLVTMAISLGTVVVEFIAGAIEAVIFWAAVLGPIALVIAGIALFAAAIYEIVEHWGAISAFFKKIWGDVEKIFEDFWGYVKKWGPLVIEAVLAPFTGGLSLIVPYLISHWSEVESFFEKLPGKILDALGDLGSTLVGWIDKGWTAITAEASSLWNTFSSWWSALPGKIITALGDLGSKLVGWIDAAFTFWLTGVETAWTTISSWFADIPNKILTVIGKLGTLLLGVGHDVIQGLFDGVTNLWTTATTFFGGIKTDIGNFFSGVYNDMLNIGKRVIQGIEDGITNEVGNLWTALKGVANKIKGFLSNPLSIFSPSRVMMEQGKFIIQGLAQGIIASADTDLQPALDGVVKQVKGGLTGSNTGVGSSLSASLASAKGASSTRATSVVVQSGAVTIYAQGATAQAATSAVNDGFTQLARELQSGTAPTRVAAGG